MAIALSHHDYWALFEESAEDERNISGLKDEMIWNYPSQLGQGFVRQIQLRDGLELAIADYQVHDDIITAFPDSEHPLEYTFHLSEQQRTTSNIPYYLYGSGTCPAELWKLASQERSAWVSVHIQPEVFRSFASRESEAIPLEFEHLVRNPSQEYYVRSGRSTPAMQAILQQILHCPYQGFTKRMFLESKVWELMVLLLEDETEAQGKRSLVKLNRDDVDRIYQAKAILLQNLNNPPSLMQLARQVGLNECTLKRGFREVFNTTVFGCLRQHRMEQAKLLLMEGRMNVHEAAQAVGYASQSRFAAVFRKSFGVNPKAFSKQNQQ
ncbi:helix-turn-helix transcriptional regulator [Microcoleus sp. FACHB-1515]|uniref:helix-turn-helix transcriptional regulator n=1 Tax=Cyanophyceae TaxID=3028117 RepID=UPI001689E9CC|nr:AraC family transcriptional regulator [Microcoleus sp. FACHB-1515]MBD2091486.1 helix-turn-helix transcriptional regulator [Microcoleus sp. FACHB-1515]